MRKLALSIALLLLSTTTLLAQIDYEQQRVFKSELKQQIKQELTEELGLEQEKKSKIRLKPYGFVRNYITYDSRECVAVLGEMFNIIPQDQLLNEDRSEDLNDVDKLSFVAFTTRLGVDVAGPTIGRAESSAKIEADFSGYGANNTLFRIRQAYLSLDWERTTLICGQTWHPMTNQVMPAVYGFGTSSPFMPFNRAPQVKVLVDAGKGWNFTAAALYQFPNLSIGPEGVSVSYSRWSMLPELYASWKHVGEHLTYGIGVDMLSITPRKTSLAEREVLQEDGTMQTQMVQVRAKDRVMGISSEVFADYINGKFNIKGKFVSAENAAHMTMVSGFGATAYDPKSGSYRYAPIRSISTWLTATYGNQLKPGLMLGYAKNYGAKNDFMSLDEIWVRHAKNTDYIYRISPSLSYTVKNLQLALEVDYTVVGYGDLQLNGSVNATRDISNTRACLMVKYSF